MIKSINIKAQCEFTDSNSYFVRVDFERGALDVLLTALSDGMGPELDVEADVTVAGMRFETVVAWGDEIDVEQEFFGGITSLPAVNSFAARRFPDHDRLTLSILKQYEGVDAVDHTLWFTAPEDLPDNHWILPAHIIRNLLAA